MKLKFIILFLIFDDVTYDYYEWFESNKYLEFNLLNGINMWKLKSKEWFTKKYKSVLLTQYPIGINFHKNRLKIWKLLSVLKGLCNLKNPRFYMQERYERHIKLVLLYI